MKYKKLKKTLISLGVIITSPFISSVIMKIVPNISVTANRLANTTIGETSGNVALNDENTLQEPTIVQETTPNWSDNILSNGLGWDYSLDDTSDSFDFFDEKFNLTAGEEPYPDVDTLTNHSGNVIQTILNNYSGTQYVTLSSGALVKNVTSVSNNTLLNESKNLPEFTIDLNSDEPQVLIMHTHTTESFEPFERTYYDSSFSYRTTDNSKNVVMVGDMIAQELENAGIKTIHNSTVHDYPSYTGSYERSAVTVQSILDEYPSIKVVLDIHRDALSRDGDLLQPVVEIDGKKSAQIMIISGCDDGTMNMPNYMQNFRLASLLQNQIYSDYGDFARPILFDYRKYNQDLTTGSLLIEVGTHGSTLEQVRYAGQLLGKSIAKALVSIST
ncbi:MAG: stage II sporulation protein P [Ruminococcus sp.]|nr:stage II sporulation protein P [Ruminococcus sp.]